MEQLIDISYFVGEINIAQLGQLAVAEDVDRFITKYQSRYLRAVLGYAFSKQFEDNYNSETEDEWSAIVNGSAYVDANGITQYWNGLVDEDAVVSPIANYVYYKYIADLQSATTASGEKEDNAQGSLNVAAAGKQARAWNEMVVMNFQLVDFLLNKKTDGDRDYPDFEFDTCNLSAERADMFTRINVFNL